MPYIKADDGRRTALRAGDTAQTAGELNYQIFYFIKHNPVTSFNNEVVKGFVVQFLGEKPNYQKYNDVAGVMVLCYGEIKRRLNQEYDYLFDIVKDLVPTIDKYEDIKIQENGDVE